MSAVLPNSPVLSSAARSFCVSSSQTSDPRTNSPSFRFWPEIFVFARLRGWAAEEEKEDEEEELGIFLGGVLRMEGVDVVRWLGRNGK